MLRDMKKESMMQSTLHAMQVYFSRLLICGCTSAK